MNKLRKATAEPMPEPKPSKPGTVKDTNSTQAKVTAAYLNIRTAASSKSRIITAVPRGTMLNVIGTDKYGWIKISYNGCTAFVYGKYVTLLP